MVFCLILLGGVAIYMAPHLGWVADGVRSSSMSPVITRGTLVIAKPVRSDSIALGDIIIFRNGSARDNYVCHRVVGVTKSSPLIFYTKGDAQAYQDTEPVLAQNVLAKVVAHIPLIGFAAIFIKTPLGFIISIVIPGLAVAFMCLSALRSELIGKRKRTQS